MYIFQFSASGESILKRTEQSDIHKYSICNLQSQFVRVRAVRRNPTRSGV
ncbi:hypothetical protein D1BOALGB6SA_8643 [Olavius sp. associated proteobacterium Delta 1]|nr:hypothetical protein D1BOALGB6SA_8643 [Olavius sp. associated proteobacterium Delta 1]